jgi:hypothetical protein
VKSLSMELPDAGTGAVELGGKSVQYRSTLSGPRRSRATRAGIPDHDAIGGEIIYDHRSRADELNPADSRSRQNHQNYHTQSSPGLSSILISLARVRSLLKPRVVTSSTMRVTFATLGPLIIHFPRHMGKAADYQERFPMCHRCV